MPSPRFWKMCLSDVNGAWPIQVTPSPPIWVISDVRRSGIQIAMPWQPMPAMARLPSGTLGRGVVRAARAEERRARHLRRRRGQQLLLGFEAGQRAGCSSGDSPPCFIRRPAITMATPVGDSSPSLGQHEAAGLVGLADDQRPLASAGRL